MWMVTLCACPEENRNHSIMQEGGLWGQLTRQHLVLLTLKDAEETSLGTVPGDPHQQISYEGKCWLLPCQAGAAVVPSPSPLCTLRGRATTLHPRDAAQPSPSRQA